MVKLDKIQSKKNILGIALLSSFLAASYVKSKCKNEKVVGFASTVTLLVPYVLTFLYSKKEDNINLGKILKKKN